jgi:hypothetical protein
MKPFSNTVCVYTVLYAVKTAMAATVAVTAVIIVVVPTSAITKLTHTDATGQVKEKITLSQVKLH